MLNPDQSPSAAPSAAAIIAAALNVANSTSASNSPPELFSMTTTSNSQLGIPFSPINAAASPLNSATVQQLANAQLMALCNQQHQHQQIAVASIPSPGGSAFAQPPPNLRPAAAHFGPASPAASAFAQELLRNAITANSAVENGAVAAPLDILASAAQAQVVQQHGMPQLQHLGQPVQNLPLAAVLANQLQQQAQTLGQVASLLGQNPAALNAPIQLTPQQQLATMLAQHQQIQQQHGQYGRIEQYQQIQNHVDATNLAHPQRTSSNTFAPNNSTLSDEKQSQPFTTSGHSDPSALEGQSAEGHNGNNTMEFQPNQQQHSSVRRIRRRRPKDEGELSRRNSIGQLKQPKPESPNSDAGGCGGGNPLSVQSTTGGAGGGEFQVKMEVDEQQQNPLKSTQNNPNNQNMLATAASAALFQQGSSANYLPPGVAAPPTPSGMATGNSPPSLVAEKSNGGFQRGDSEMRRQSVQSVDSLSAADEAARTKTCRVCGDSATGYNFNVISCESCKAFFRRNALRPKEFKCPYANDCEINAVSRRFCQKCRLRKCFAVGMKKEWILSDEQLRRRKNARIKGQMSKDEPRTPSSNNSMAPATPFSGGPQSSAISAFSPPQQQHQQQQQFFHAQQHQQQPVVQNPQLQQPPQSHQQLASIAAVLLQGQSQSPLALAIQKLAASPQNPQQQQQNSSPGNGSMLGLDVASPLTAFGNSPPEAAKPILGVEQPKVSPSGAHSPPPILPVVPAGEGQPTQQFDPNIIRFAQQQIAQAASAALVAQQQQRRQSDGLLSLATGGFQVPAAPPQQSPNSLSPLVEQYRMMMQAQAGQSAQTTPNSLLLTVQTSPGGQKSTEASPAGSSGMLTAETAHQLLGTTTTTSTSSSSNPTSLPNGMNFMTMDPRQQEFLMKMKMQHTIQDELGSAMSPPAESGGISPGISAASTPAKLLEDEEMRALERERKMTLSRQFALNSLEQHQLHAVKSTFACMDDELKMELMKNPKLMAIMTQKGTQSPADMMVLLDMLMRRFVKLAKRLSTFNELSPGGKFSLLKAAMIDLLTLRGASRLDAERRCWKSPLLNNTEINCKIDMFDKLNDNMQKRRVMDFYKSLHEKLKTDQVANNLIVVTVLFNHFTDTELSAEDRVLAEKHYKQYENLLERYLQSVYGPEEAKQIFGEVPKALQMLKDVTKSVPGLFQSEQIDKDAKGSLFVEFFKVQPKGGGGGVEEEGQKPEKVEMKKEE